MNVSLEKHAQSYDLSNTDLMLCLTTGLSGAPLAARHFDLANKSSEFFDRMGHRTIGIIESLPVLGGIVATIEKTAFHTQQLFSITIGSCYLTPTIAATSVTTEDLSKTVSAREVIDITTEAEDTSLSPDKASMESVAYKVHLVALEKMYKNSIKAIEEHTKAVATHKFSPVEECLPALSILQSHKPTSILNFDHSVTERQGIRPSMEDAHLFKKIEGGAIAAVFDGHGGSQVAKFASSKFEEYFLKFMKATSGNIRESFISSINHIEEEVAKKEEWDGQGTTAVISYIDEKSHLIYTATLADSEANIYRKGKEGKLISIPLSCIRNWAHPKEAERASIALEDPDIKEEWPKQNPKSLRVSFLNISRAIGDIAAKKMYKDASIISKPKISVNLLKPGDVLILACDGLKDYVGEDTIIEKIQSTESKTDVSKELVDYAIDKAWSSDNVTVLTVHIS